MVHIPLKDYVTPWLSFVKQNFFFFFSAILAKLTEQDPTQNFSLVVIRDVLKNTYILLTVT